MSAMNVVPLGLEITRDRSDADMWHIIHPIRRYRVLLSSGTVLDVTSTHLNNDARSELLKAIGEADANISGITVMAEFR